MPISTQALAVMTFGLSEYAIHHYAPIPAYGRLIGA